jgi:hypothetical protein
MVFATRYEAAITWIVSLCPPPDKFAHTYAGLAIWLVAALVLRRSLASVAPLLVVILAEVANEIVDRFAHGSWMWPDTLRDAAATWFWPLLLAGLMRWVPFLRR